MSLTDPISNLLTSIQNGNRAQKPYVDVRASGLGAAIVDCLKREGFVQNWRLVKEVSLQGSLRVYLKYTKDRLPIIRRIRRVSKPGLRIYVRKAKIQKVLSGVGMAILSTPQGVLSDSQARVQGVGGEVICHVW